MKRILFFLLILFSSNAFSQSMHGISYATALGVGETSDYISRFSWRGFGIDGKYFINDNMTLGWTTGWQTFYEPVSGTFTEGTQTRTGTQYRYINTIPVMLTYNFFFNEDGETQPFVGLGLGTYWLERRTTMGLFASTEDNWHFGLTPEVGILFPVNIQSNFYVTVRYNNAFPSNDSITYSYLGLNLGFLWY
jgi:outer membrane protein W